MTQVSGKYGEFLSEATIAPAGSGALKGKTVGLKDLLLTADIAPTTAASKILEPFQAPYQATVVEKILAAGAEATGKTNHDEFGMGTSNENSAYGPVSNPWDMSRVPGGSSGGSAAGVAARSFDIALGTDTGGSSRQPAAFCGVVGLKPTYGRVSRYGVVAAASSLEQVGIFSVDVADAAKTLQVIAGQDPRDATTVDRPVPDYPAGLTGDVKGLRIGLPKEYFIEGIQPEVAAAVEQVADDLKAAGVIVSEVSLPHTKYGIAAYYIIMPAEASSNLARYDGIRYGHSDQSGETLEDVYLDSRSSGLGAEPKRRIMLGTYALSAGYYDAYYKKAMQVRTLIREDFDQVFSKVDLLLTPTAPTTAFKLGEKADDPLELYLNDVFTVSANLAGIPGISVPCGFDKAGLPIGMQLMAPQWGEEQMLRAAHAYEQQHDWHTKRPGGKNG